MQYTFQKRVLLKKKVLEVSVNKKILFLETHLCDRLRHQYCKTSINFFFYLQAFLFYGQECISVIKFVPKCTTPKELKKSIKIMP